MALPTLLRKLFKNDGYGPDIKDERLSTDITVKDWDASHDYPANVLAKAGGDIYRSVAASGPGTSAGAVNPTQDASADYWEVFGNFVHLTGNEVIDGEKSFNQLINFLTDYDKTTTPSDTKYKTIANILDSDGSIISDIYLAEDTNQVRSTILRTWSKSGQKSIGWYIYQPEGNRRGFCWGNLFKDIDLVNNDWTRGTAVSEQTWWSIPFSGKTVESVGGIWGYVTPYRNGTGVEIRCTPNAASFNDYATFWLNVYSDTERLAGVRCSVFRPSLDSYPTLGASGTGRWKHVYATDTAITTSDARLKTEIDLIPDSVLDVWGRCNFKKFKKIAAVNEKGVDSARVHIGMIAQDLKKEFSDANIDIEQFGLFCYDSWEASEAKLNEKGEVMEKAVPAGNEYSLRYEEALCMEAAYQRRRADRAEARISALEARLAALEAKLNG